MRLIKLVRDRVEVFAAHHKRITYAELTPEQHVLELRRKLGEEALEYILDPCAAELADVLEVVWALASVDLGVGFDRINEVRKAKHRERGGFWDARGMYACE